MACLANEQTENSCVLSEPSQKYNFSICALFKNEAKYLKEWIEYHRLVGVDHFYLYDIGSTDYFLKVLRPYIRENIVTLIRWQDYVGEKHEEDPFLWALGTQIPAYENAARYTAWKETKWLVFMDVDEFLVAPHASTVCEVLEEYKGCSGITIACDHFDASEEKTFPQKRLLIEAVDLTKAPEKKLERTIAKMVFQPEQYLGFVWPPYQCVFKEGREPIMIGRAELRINHYTHRNIAYFSKKIKQKLLIDNRRLTDAEMCDLLALDYAIEDQDRAIFRFIPELYKRLEYEFPKGG